MSDEQVYEMGILAALSATVTIPHETWGAAVTALGERMQDVLREGATNVPPGASVTTEVMAAGVSHAMNLLQSQGHCMSPDVEVMASALLTACAALVINRHAAHEMIRSGALDSTIVKDATSDAAPAPNGATSDAAPAPNGAAKTAYPEGDPRNDPDYDGTAGVEPAETEAAHS